MPHHQSGSSAARATPAALPGVCHDAAVARIYEQLGSDITLITAPPGQPWALREAQQPPPPRETWALTHQLNLAEGIVAIALGKASSGLVALLATDRAVLAAFIAANAALAGLLPVEHPAGFVVFIRVNGPMPPSRTLGGFTWLADEASFTVLTRSPRRWDAFAGSTSPRASAPVRLDQLDWRPLGEFGLALLRDVLDRTHGEPFRSSSASQGRLQIPFWAALATRWLGVRYDAYRRAFQRQAGPAAPWEEVPRPLLARLVSELVVATPSAAASNYCPTPSELRRVMASMAVMAAAPVADGQALFRHCVAELVERSPGEVLTCAELQAAIAEHHRRQGRPMPSPAVAGRWTNLLMQELHNAKQQRNLEGDTGWCRGFRGFALRSPAALTQETR